MLTASTLRRRNLFAPCALNNKLLARFFRSRGDGRRPPRVLSRSREDITSSGTSNASRRITKKEVEDIKEPSLFAQLFPDQDAARPRKETEREIPRINRLHVDVRQPNRPRNSQEKPPSAYEATIRHQDENLGQEASVLILRNASKNLIEEDFRRLIPRGQHIEGWTLEQGDILQVVPGRDLITLEHLGYYYLLFASALGAFTYQGHATRMHQLVSAHTPSSILSPMLPPPGYLMQGIDANVAINSFTLVPPNQSLDLRQLKPPLSPMVQAIIRNGGYPDIVKRAGRMPFELRLTLDGPQLHYSNIRHILMQSGKDRGLSWSGEEGQATPVIANWQGPSEYRSPSLPSDTLEADKWQDKQEKRERIAESEGDGEATQPVVRAVDEYEGRQEQQKRRTPQLVYIVGFSTERAMQSFVAYWHRRPMELANNKKECLEGEVDLPPVTFLEVLW